MIVRNYLGLDITAGELRGVSLRRHGKGTRLAGGRVLPLPSGAVAPSVREPNILDVARLTEGVREVLGPLAGREDRIALSLPESAGRIVLTEVETPFRNRAEGAEILKWQLKSSLPVEGKDVRLDYQVLEKNESGRFRVVVALIAGKVLQQYEEVLSAAGYHPAVVDFHCLNLYNYYRPRLDLGENFVLVGLEQGVFSLQYFQGRVLAFQRARDLEPTPMRIFQELNRTLVGCLDAFPAFRRAAIFLHCDWEERDPLLEALRSAFEREVLCLDPHLEKMVSPPSQIALREGRRLMAAVGAAERMM